MLVACNRTIINICSMHCNAISFGLIVRLGRILMCEIESVCVDALCFSLNSAFVSEHRRYLGTIMYSVDILYMYFFFSSSWAHCRCSHILVARFTDTQAGGDGDVDGATRCSAGCKSKIYDLKRGNKQCNNQINKLLHRPYAHFFLLVCCCRCYCIVLWLWDHAGCIVLRCFIVRCSWHSLSNRRKKRKKK